MEIITRKRTVWLTFLDVLYKKKLPLQSIHAKGGRERSSHSETSSAEVWFAFPFQ